MFWALQLTMEQHVKEFQGQQERDKKQQKNTYETNWDDLGISQVVLIVKNLPANAGDLRDVGLIPGLGRYPWKRAWQPTLVFLPEESRGQRGLAKSWTQLKLPCARTHTHTHTHFSDQWFLQIIWKNNFRNRGMFAWILLSSIGKLWKTYSPGQADSVTCHLRPSLVFSLDLAYGDCSSLLLLSALSSVNLWMNWKREVKHVEFIYRSFHYFYIFN